MITILMKSLSRMTSMILRIKDNIIVLLVIGIARKGCRTMTRITTARTENIRKGGCKFKRWGRNKQR
jgi:hypothetical protein